MLVSGTAIARSARELVNEYLSSVLWSKTAGDADRIDARMVAEAAAENDSLAVRVFVQAARYFRLGLVNLIFFLYPR